MRSLKHLIPQAVNRAGIGGQVHATNVVQAAKDFLDVAMLPDMRGSARVVSYARSVLKIQCEHSVAAHEVRSLEGGIIDAIVSSEPRCQLRRVQILTGTLRASDYDV